MTISSEAWCLCPLVFPFTSHMTILKASKAKHTQELHTLSLHSNISFSPSKWSDLSLQVKNNRTPSSPLTTVGFISHATFLVFHAHPTLIAPSHMHASLSLLSPPTFPLTRTTMKLSHSSLIPLFAAEDHPRSQPRLTQISLIFKASKRNIKQRRVLATLQDHRTSRAIQARRFQPLITSFSWLLI